MNRLLTGATALALGLVLGGTATGDSRHGRRYGYDRWAGDQPADCERDGLQYLDPWQQPDWHDYRDFDYWWFDPYDLRHFDYWQVNQYCIHHGQR